AAAYAALGVPLVLSLAAWPALASLRFLVVALAAILSVAGTMLLLARDGRPVSGANDDASGLAAVLAAAGEHAVRPLEQTNLEVLVTGAAEVGPWGVRRFTRRFGKHYLRERTYILDVSSVGRGEFAALEREGLLVSTPGDPELVQAVKAAARHEGYRHVKAELAMPGDGHFARLRGWKAATLVALERGRIPDHHCEADALPRIDPLQIEAAARLVIGTTRELDRMDMPAVARRRTIR
ncbi:MAG TPA: M20/M25/M40 family metallo-hydrolase, partial [Candidatus Thermoplasmatota archaeon]|nr:M20/M25/M40 family metallo-hydrolase [Candidatus Thermoplasmatota archaeon]